MPVDAMKQVAPTPALLIGTPLDPQDDARALARSLGRYRRLAER
jgi:hypothetical protein